MIARSILSATLVLLPALAAAPSLVYAQATKAAAPSSASGPFEATLTLKDHVFTPSVITAPAGRKLKLTIINKDPNYEEFDSVDLDREADIPASGTGIVYLGPLKPGTYEFIGEIHRRTAQGKLVIK